MANSTELQVSGYSNPKGASCLASHFKYSVGIYFSLGTNLVICPNFYEVLSPTLFATLQPFHKLASQWPSMLTSNGTGFLSRSSTEPTGYTFFL
jgi:hypothetical protein